MSLLEDRPAGMFYVIGNFLSCAEKFSGLSYKTKR